MLDGPARPTLADDSLWREANLVGGEWIGAADGTTIAVTNPADGRVIGHVPSLSRAEVARAVDAAHAAQKAWRALAAKERAAVLRRLFELMMASQEDLARIMTAEQGKPLAEARGEIAYAAAFIESFGEGIEDYLEIKYLCLGGING